MAAPAGWTACVRAATAAAGRDLSDDELEAVFTRAHNRTRFYAGQGMAPDAAAARAGGELGAEIRLAAAIEKRQATLNMLARRRLDARVADAPDASPYRVVLATLTGIERGGAFRGAADSVDAQWHGLRNRMFGGLLHDLRQAGLVRALRRHDEAFDRDVARALWKIRQPAAGGAPSSGPAAEAARILHRYQEWARSELNDAGAHIEALDTYVARQSHDQLKVRSDGGAQAFAQWRDFILPRLDPVTFRDADDPEKMLRNIWQNLASGVHTTSTSTTLAGYSGPGNLARRVSQERVLHFRDADAWMDYHQQFGRGNLMGAIVAQIDRAARDTALMRTLGTNPQAMLDGWLERLTVAARDRNDFAEVDRLRRGWPRRVLEVLDGRAALPERPALAHVGANWRGLQNLAKLGGVILSSLPDLAVNAAMLRHNGVPLFHAYAQEMTGLLPRGAETRALADQLGAGIDLMLGDIAQRFQSENAMAGGIARASDLFFRLNGLSYWTDSLKRTSSLVLSNNLAERAATAFDGLPGRMQTTLRRYGIEAAEWDAIRAAPQQAADGRNYILPEAVADDGAQRKLSAYLADQVREGMTEADAGSRAMLTMGTRAGTYEGELLRLLTQFKQFSTTFMSRTLGREFARDGADVGGVAHLVVATTALGYLAMTLKELAKGRTPREPDDAVGYGKVVAAALVQGGGLGIYGDFLFGEANRFGGGIVGTLAGPTAGTMEQLTRVIASARGEGNAAAEAIRLGVNHAPFVNLFYTRLALDHLILFRMQEWANPGYLRRYEQRIKRENDQTFWLRPTDAVR